MAGYAIVSDDRVTETGSLPMGETSQKAERVALTWAPTPGQGKTVNIYTDSKYALHILYHYAAVWKEKGFLFISQGILHHRWSSYP